MLQDGANYGIVEDKNPRVCRYSDLSTRQVFTTANFNILVNISLFVTKIFFTVFLDRRQWTSEVEVSRETKCLGTSTKESGSLFPELQFQL